MAFHEQLPEHALAAGADLVISSTHKIVGSLTQSAMLHLGHGELIGEQEVDRAVTLTESTSPSSLLSPRWTRPAARPPPRGARQLSKTIAALAQRTRGRSARSRAWTCSTSAWSGAPGRVRL